MKKPLPGWILLACGVAVGVLFTILFSLEPGRDDIRRPTGEQSAEAARTQPKTPAPTPAKSKFDFYTMLPESPVVTSPQAQGNTSAVPAQKPVSAEEAARIDAARALAALSGQTPPPPPVIAPPAPAPAPATPPATATPAAASPPSTTAAAPAPRLYLQAGAFRSRNDADRVRAQLLLLGENPQIETGTVRGETWYRVMLGPYGSREQQQRSQKELAAGGINSLPQQR